MKEPYNLHLPDVQARCSPGELTSLRVPALHRAWDVGLWAGGILTPLASVPRGPTRPQQLCRKAGWSTGLCFWAGRGGCGSAGARTAKQAGAAADSLRGPLHPRYVVAGMDTLAPHPAAL